MSRLSRRNVPFVALTYYPVCVGLHKIRSERLGLPFKFGQIFSLFLVIFDRFRPVLVKQIRSEKLQNESFPNFSNFRPEFCPEFCSEFSPNFSRTFRASFCGRRRPEKIHQKSPPFFNAKFPGKHEKNIHKILLESRQTKKKTKKKKQIKISFSTRGFSMRGHMRGGALSLESQVTTLMFSNSQCRVHEILWERLPSSD